MGSQTTKVLLTAGLAALAIGCEPTPSAPESDVPDGETTTEIAPEALTETAAAPSRTDGVVVQMQRPDTPMPEAPQGCEYLFDDPEYWSLRCGSTFATLSRMEQQEYGESQAEMMIAGQITTLKNSGWETTRHEQPVELTTPENQTLSLTHVRIQRSGADRAVYTDFVSSEPGGLERVYTCNVAGDADPLEAGCGDLLAPLQALAAANRVTGLAILGEPLLIPDHCLTMDYAVFCGAGSLLWAELPENTNESVVRAPEAIAMEHLKTKQVPTTHYEMACEFAGAPMECEGITLQFPGHNPQLAVYGYAQREGMKLRFICEGPVLPQGPALPEVCELFMKGEFGAAKE